MSAGEQKQNLATTEEEEEMENHQQRVEISKLKEKIRCIISGDTNGN